jgi:hypothetical protein
MLVEIKGGKLATRGGSLLAELTPTPKIISELRAWFPKAKIIGWKYEVDGSRDDAIAKGRDQIRTCHTNACVVNGSAYGDGFGLLGGQGAIRHIKNRGELLTALAVCVETTEA